MRGHAPLRGLRAAMAFAGTALLAACGSSTVTQTVTATAPPGGEPTASASASAGSTTSTQTQTATPTPQPTAPPQPPPTPVAVAMVRYLGATDKVTLVGLDGGVIASADVADLRETAGGPGYVLAVGGSSLVKLTTGGQVQTLGGAGVPGSLTPGAAVSPDGTRWAFATMTMSGSAFTNRLYAGVVGQAPAVVAERTGDADSTTAPADAPSPWWSYHVIAWVPQGIVVGRVPYGIGYVGPFDDEIDRYTALVDPATGRATAISNDKATSMSSVAVDGTAVLFHHTSSGGVDSIRLVRAGTTVGTAALSGQNHAGAGVYNPAGPAIAYATVPISASNPDAMLSGTTLRILHLNQQDALAVPVQGLRPLAWMPEGWVLAQRMEQTGGDLAASAVKVSPTGAVQTVASGGSGSHVGAVVVAP